MRFIKINGNVPKDLWEREKQRVVNFVTAGTETELVIVCDGYARQSAWLFSELKSRGVNVRVCDLSFVRRHPNEQLMYVNFLRNRSEVKTLYKVLAYEYPLKAQLFL